MAGIFISYRREDASGHAGALMRALETHFPPKNVFLDITDIRGGEAFPETLAAAIRQADVVLVLIGARWLDARDAAGRRRLDDPADYVRHEVALGLRDADRVIPILLDGTRMPSADELPGEIRALAFRNAMALGNRHWQRDVDLIVDEVRKASFACRPASPDKAVVVPTDFKRGRAPARAWLLIGAAFLLFALIFLAVAGVLAWNTAAFLARAVQTEGTVVELAATGNGLFRPIIRFTTAGGETITFPAAQASTPPAYDVGQTVGVAHDPARPRDARLKAGYLLALGLRDADRVIPILLDGTRMPSADELPDEIRALAFRNAMALGNRDWQRDVDLIVDEVRKASFACRPASPDKAVAVPTDFKRGRAPARAWLLIGAAFLLFALIFLAVAGVLAWNTAAFLARAVQTEGTVVELAATGDGLFRPIIRFTTAGGETITFPAAQASTPPAYDVGQTVGVAHDPARPRDARLKAGYLLEAIFAGFAALFGAIGGGIVAKVEWHPGELYPRVGFISRPAERVDNPTAGRHSYVRGPSPGLTTCRRARSTFCRSTAVRCASTASSYFGSSHSVSSNIWR